MLVTMMMLALAAPNPTALDRPRKAYATCIKAFETKSVAAKLDAAAYATALKGMCQPEAAALTRALTDYDVAMGSKRATAASNAATDVADYQLSSEERFRDLVPAARPTQTAAAPATPQPPATPVVTNASAPK